MFENLTDKNYYLYAVKCYSSPNCIMSEFEDDIKHIKYIKRLFQKYKETKILKERLILNHIICLGNVFGVPHATRMLFFKIQESDYNILKTFLLYLNYLPDVVEGIDGKDIKTDEIPIDVEIAKILRGV